MRKFKSFEEFELFFDGINAAFEFLMPSEFRRTIFESVMHSLSDVRSSVHCSFSHPVYVLFGPQFCCYSTSMSTTLLEKFKRNYCVYEIYFTSSFIIVKQL